MRGCRLLFALFLVVALSLPASSTDIQWTRYRNERWKFCTEVPKQWVMDEGVDRAGVRVSLPRSADQSSIAVGALPNQCVDIPGAYGLRCDRMQTLDEIERGEITEFNEQGVTELSTITSKKQIFHAATALLTRLSYRKQGQPVINQTLRFLVGKTSYAIEFQCRPTDVAQCEAVFSHMQAVFKLDCE